MKVALTTLMLAMLTALGGTAQADNLPRVLSLNLCADPYLMAFAEKSQVLALTPQSRDTALSAFVEAAKTYPISNGQIETIAALKPDFVIVSSYSDPMRNRLMKALGIAIITLDAANSYEASRQEILKLGLAIGRETQATAYLQNLDAALARAKPRGSALGPARILPLQRRNLTVGHGHILDEIIAMAGAINMGRQNSSGLMGRISLETAITAQADYILINQKSGKPDSRGMEFIAHPALDAAYSDKQRLHIDNNLLVCAGATTPRAVAALGRQLRD